jgi:hypothetical protein
MRTAIFLTFLALAACSNPAPQLNETDPAPDVDEVDELAGRWTGVEGMYLVVRPAGVAGRYKLEMQWDLDHKGRFDGVAEDGGIAFTRDGVKQMLRSSDGSDTGLKYLADKNDCLFVKAGEGYCRD